MTVSLPHMYQRAKATTVSNRHAEQHQHTRSHWCGGRRRDRRAWLRCPWAAEGPGRAIHSDLAPLVWRAPEGPEGLAAVPVGGGGAWQGYSQRPSPTGVEGAGGTGGPGCGARGRWRGQAAVLVGGGRARAGLEIDHSERSSRVAISRAGRRRPAHTAARPIKAGHATVENQPSPTVPRTPVAPQAT